jgi:transcriptional regulator with XRE-family HTH domain
MDRLSLFEGQLLKSLRTPAHQELLRLLIAARDKAGLTQQELAKRLKRDQSFVAKYETGVRRLEVIEFVEICRKMGVSPESLIRQLP